MVILLGSLSSALYAQSELDGIMATTDEHGRTVFVNAPKPRAGKPSREARPARTSVLVYWSNKESRWKPVSPPSPAVMQAARRAADEVAGYVQSQPATLAGTRTPASTNPNYKQLAHGHAVSTGAIDAAIEEAAARHGVDANLVRAVIKVESNFDPHAVSKKGAMGLMQLMPATARELKVSNPFDPQQNVDGGVRYLKDLLTSYHGDVKLTLAAYNAGPNAVARANGVPNYTETRNYVRQITDMYGNGSPAGRAGRSSAAPVRVFRDGSGVLTITNE